MGQGHHHGERAFEAFLRARRTPYVSVNEARRSLLPDDGPADLKSFDFVVYTAATSVGGANLLVDVKCRRLPALRPPSPPPPPLRIVGVDGVPRTAAHTPSRNRSGRLESWATLEDVRSLRAWEGLFGAGFKAAFVFVYWCDATPGAGGAAQPPDGLFDEVFLEGGRWYAVRGVLLDDYQPAMQVRSARWQTVDLPPARFERLSDGFGRGWLGGPRRVQVPPAVAAGR
jgi:hypothetical protein